MLKRRHFLALLAGLFGAPLWSRQSSIIKKTIPSTGESISVIGMGTWLTFDVEDDAAGRAVRVQVLRRFLQKGGRMIDSSPMYGSSQEVIGHCLNRLKAEDKIFSATKVWTYSQSSGRRQIRQAKSLWGVGKFDLMQIHNLLAWPKHMETLQKLKANGAIRYLGITTSHGRRHEEMIKIMQKYPLDFVQLTYNILDREAEAYLLPLAKERGIAVIANRPFQGGGLFSKFENRPLPVWAEEIACANWAQFFLRFVVSHSAVTCAIPATSRVDHMLENMGANYGVLLDGIQRKKMLSYIRSI